MGFQPVILWTDALVYVLLVLVAGMVWYTRRYEHLLMPWRRVTGSRTGQATIVILAFYIVIGLLDTLHFNPQSGMDADGRAVYSTEVLSLFDHLADDLRTQREKTYSAPFATHPGCLATDHTTMAAARKARRTQSRRPAANTCKQAFGP